MRLDHLLSRENRVQTHGGVGALMAPRLIARSIASPRQVERAGPGSREHGPEADCDLARNTEPRSDI